MLIVLGHPAVVNSDIDASLGLLAVKKTNEGIALFFAHNTDSFVSLLPFYENLELLISSHRPLAHSRAETKRPSV